MINHFNSITSSMESDVFRPGLRKEKVFFEESYRRIRMSATKQFSFAVSYQTYLIRQKFYDENTLYF